MTSMDANAFVPSFARDAESPMSSGDVHQSCSPVGIDTDEEVGKEITVCVGDIHGNLDKLERLWSNLEFLIGSEIFKHCSVVFLGDYCDRGPETKGVIEFLSTLSQRYPSQEHAFIAGNHDVAMAAFVGALPPAPNSFEMSQTWSESNGRLEEKWWTGIGVEEMHLKGRRWGGVFNGKNNSTYDSAPTFASYGVEHGDREGLVAAMPKHHILFLQNLKWVHEALGPKSGEYVGLIAVHAGLEQDKPIAEQLELLRSRDVTASRWESLNGRDEVRDPPREAVERNLLIVSGHHGFLDTESKNRLIIDEFGGRPQFPLTAVVLPRRVIVRDTDEK